MQIVKRYSLTVLLILAFQIPWIWSQVPPDTTSVTFEHSSYEELIKIVDKNFNEQNCHLFLPGAYKRAALAEKEFGISHVEYAFSLRDLALKLFICNDIKEAQRLLKSNIDIYLAQPDNNEFNLSCLYEYLGYLYMKDGHHQQAIKYGNEAVAWAKKSKHSFHYRLGGALTYLAYPYDKTARFDKAFELGQKGKHHLQIALKEEKEPNITRFFFLESTITDMYQSNLKFLGNVYKNTGQYEKALPLFLEGIAFRKSQVGEMDGNYCYRLLDLGLLYTEMGLYEEAENTLVKAAEIYAITNGKNTGWYGRIMNALGEVYFKTGRYAEALPAYQIAFDNYTVSYGETHPYCSNFLGNIAKTYGMQNDFEKAMDLTIQATELAKKSLDNQHPDYAARLYEQAMLLQSIGDYKKSLPLLLEAKDIALNSWGDHHKTYGKYSLALALNHATSGNIDEATKMLLKANENIKYSIQNQFDQFSEYEQQAMFASIQQHADLIHSFNLDHQNDVSLTKICYDNALMFKGLTLGNRQRMLETVRLNKDAYIQDIFKEWSSARQLLSWQYSLPINKRMPSVDSLESRANQLESQLARASTAFQQVRQLTSWKDVQSQLVEGEVAIEFTHFKYHTPGKHTPTDSIIYVAYLIRKNFQAPQLIALFESSQLKSIRAIRRLYQYNKESLQPNLYELIWQPLKSYLEDIHTIYFAPSGILHHVNFGAIPINATTTLSDQYILHNVLSTRQIIRQETPTNKDSLNAIIYGGIQYHRELDQEVNQGHASPLPKTSSKIEEWPYLEWTLTEANEVANLLKLSGASIEIKKNSEANESHFKTIGSKQVSPCILHLATHGYFFPPPNTRPNKQQAIVFQEAEHPLVRSGLILANANQAWLGATTPEGKEDGILTAYEIAQMDLNNTKLVVLSACNTGLGDIKNHEGVYGLQRAFKMAGVDYILMSLWEVNDLQTYEFMTAFYKEWLSGKTIPAAFQATQNQIRKKHLKPFNPSAWAGFILIE